MVKTFDEVQRAILRVLQLLAQDADSLLETDVVLLAPTAPITANGRPGARYVIENQRKRPHRRTRSLCILLCSESNRSSFTGVYLEV